MSDTGHLGSTGLGGKNVPIGGASTQHSGAGVGLSGSGASHPASTTTSRGGYGKSEAKDTMNEGIEQVKHVANECYHSAKDVCQNWRHYPKLLTSVLLLSTFLLGAGTAGIGSKLLGIGGQSYVTSHWNREAYDAHHALDVVLDHIKYPHLYENERGSTMIGRARTGIMDLLSGMMPGRSKVGGRGGGVTDYAQSMGRDVYDKTMNRGMMDKAGDYAQQMGSAAKDVGYGLSHKLGNVADSAKNLMGGGGDNYGQYAQRMMKPKSSGWLGSKLWGGSSGSVMDDSDHDSTGWFGGHDQRGSGWMGGRDDDAYGSNRDEFELATQKLQKVARAADRQL